LKLKQGKNLGQLYLEDPAEGALADVSDVYDVVARVLQLF
jgi:hypothetical protein